MKLRLFIAFLVVQSSLLYASHLAYGSDHLEDLLTSSLEFSQGGVDFVGVNREGGEDPQDESASSEEGGEQTVGEDPLWETIVPGIDYRLFKLSDPNRVYVTRMDRSNPELIIESSIGQGKIAYGTERTSDMADRYDGAINYWGEAWGNRNDVIAAINGYYYEPTGVPQRGQIHSGWYAKWFDDVQNGSGLVWKFDRTAFIGGCVNHKPAKQAITFLKSGNSQRIDGVNVPREDGNLVIYTPQYESHTLTEDMSSTVEVLIEMTSPAVVQPSSEKARGIVRLIRKNQGGTPIPFDHIVLSAHGDARDDLLANIEPGDEISISQEIAHYEIDCNTPSEDSWMGAYASIGGHFHFLSQGEVQTFDDNAGATARHPRTAIGFNDQYIFFIVVDGRHPGWSIGMTIQELAVFSRDVLGITEAVAQDGGGSSTMVIDGEVVNVPSDSCTYAVSNSYLPLVGVNQPVLPDLNRIQPVPDRIEPYREFTADELQHVIRRIKKASKVGSYEDREAAITEILYEGITSETRYECQRGVANGLMMVKVEPLDRSTAFSPGEGVVVLEEANVRLGPGTNYEVFTTAPSGSQAVVLETLSDLNGVFAKGYYWWKISVDGVEGWIAEDLLTSGN